MKKLECKNCNWNMRAETEMYHVQSDKEFQSRSKVSTSLWKCSQCGVVGIGGKNHVWYEEIFMDTDNPLEQEDDLDDLL